MRHFSKGQVSEITIGRILAAAIAAPSVGLMQPWRFIRVLNQKVRKMIRRVVLDERQKTADAIDSAEGRGEEFLKLKIDRIDSCSDLLVLCSVSSRAKHIFVRRTMQEMDFASIGCCVQNMWLAARAEGLGMGWVSLFAPEDLREILDIPKEVLPVAILCLGPVDKIYDVPMLEKENGTDEKS